MDSTISVSHHPLEETLLGTEGDDYLGAGVGASMVNGGPGNDTIFYGDQPIGIEIDLVVGLATNSLTHHTLIAIESVDASYYDDVIRLSSLDQYAFGRAGNDLLDGRGGDDFLIPGSGVDLVIGDTGLDTVSFLDDGFDGAGPVTRGILADLSLGAAVDGWGSTDLLIGIENIQGSELADALFGDAGANHLDGGELDDRLDGRLGDDMLTGGSGADTAIFSALRAQYTISRPATETFVVGGPDGQDNLDSIETLAFADGCLIFDPLDNFAKIERLYLAALDRAGDRVGVNGWSNALDSGQDFATIAAAFVASAEFSAKYGQLDNAGFVTQLYLNVLDRAPDELGRAQWVAQLDAGMSRATALAGFSESAEHIERNLTITNVGLWDIDETAATLARLYHGVLDRRPDAGGLLNWHAAAENGMAVVDIAQSFAASPEFSQTYGNLDNAGFVQRLYLNVLGRAADAGGYEAWLFHLDMGASRASVALGFTESLEFQIASLPAIDGGILIV